MRERRGLSTVADVSLALVLVLAAITTVVTVLDTDERSGDPDRAAHTAETLGASTLNVTYSLESVLETGSEHVPDPDDDDAPYDAVDFERSTHGSTMGHVARAALVDAQFGRADVSPLGVGTEYGETLGERLQVSLVGSSFASNVTAVWEPFDGAPVRGTATFGQPVPPETDRNVVRTTIPSELPDAREAAREAVGGANTGGYGAVAAAVADAIVNGSLGDTQRELETTGVERAVVVSRYLRFADAVGVSRGALDSHLDRSQADPDAMTALLADALTTRLQDDLEQFDTPERAARAVSTGEVTISVTTWHR